MASKDLEAVFSYAQSQNISINKQEFTFQVETHPDYPSILAYSDALSFFNIENIVFKAEQNQLDILPDTFLTLINKPIETNSPTLEPVFVIVEKKNDCIYVDNILISETDFF